MSRLRPTLMEAATGSAIPDDTALYAIYGAVRGQTGLCHGRLHDDAGDRCALGSFFYTQRGAVLHTALIDEVAAVNDAVPHLSKAQRKAYVLRWLRWKLTSLGMPGFRTRTR